MTDHAARVCLVTQARDSKYADVEGKAYEYPRHISNAQRIAVGDILVVALPKANAPDGRRILGLGRVGGIQGQGPDRFIASYERYLKLLKPVSFEEIGGDPRNNQTNSINAIAQRSPRSCWPGKGSGTWSHCP